MTGRRLYDKFYKFCDAAAAAAAVPHHWGTSVLPHSGNAPVAWPFLAARDRKVWNDAARRIAPRKRKP